MAFLNSMNQYPPCQRTAGGQPTRRKDDLPMDAPKFRIVLASHGEQAKGMMNTVQMLLGPQENMAAYCLYPDQTVNALTEQLENEIKTYGAENIIFMTELFHGSPFNAVVSLTREYDLYHLTGTNLAMLMTVVMERDDENATAEAICDAAIEAAQDSFKDVRKMLAESIENEEEDL
ncbi:MAG: PTS sugar transporter subunit IIA [Clostridiales bacterium]|nr:PTS sugar transporter subunit IIA [Clostridiales bacterium]